ncbi:MAG: ketoacyl-ACP synthase III [Longimonas sp.]|uniref:beta-ketoacyl-ACP synthase III n=1 Tax=Longimonas sp. TaxID=2039626 RepID=UPI00334D186E
MSTSSSSQPRAAITAMGHFLPEKRLTNADLEQIVDTDDEWIRTRTGIEERRILDDPDKATAYMASQAAEELFQKHDIDPATIDLIIVATITPDMEFPSTACLVQDSIGAQNAWGFDLAAACSGFLFALTNGASFIESGRAKRVLVIGADTMSAITDYEDRSTCILFGDAAGAVLLEPHDTYGLQDTVHYSDGAHADLLTLPAGGSLNPASHETVDQRLHYLKQDGRPVFRHAVTGMADVCVEIMERNDLTGDDVDFLVPHQANKRIIDATANRMGLSSDKVMLNIHRYGNTTAATVPLCLNDWQAELKPGHNLVLTTFGGGLTWGASYLTWAYDGAEYDS